MHPRISKKRKQRHQYYAAKVERRSTDVTASVFKLPSILSALGMTSLADEAWGLKGFGLERELARRVEDIRLADRSVDEIAVDSAKGQRIIEEAMAGVIKFRVVTDPF